jgi:DNA-binding MarR family transcriptional regulator
MTPKQTSVERALAGYRELVEILSASRAPEFPETSVTMAQMRVLMLLSVTGETRMSQLAPQLGISLSSLSSLVDRLVEADLARRRDDPTDRRNVLVSLTAQGVALLDTFQELGVEHLRALLDQLTDREIESVNHAIDVLVAAARRLTMEESS